MEAALDAAGVPDSISSSTPAPTAPAALTWSGERALKPESILVPQAVTSPGRPAPT